MSNIEYLTSLTKFYTLALLSQKPRHGYEIIKEVGERIGKKPSTGQIYPLLEEFEDDGLVVSENKDVKGRTRKVYKITDKGEETFSEVLNRFYSLVHELLDPWLVECKHCGCKIFRGRPEDEEEEVHREKIDGELLPFCCKHCANAYKNKMDNSQSE